MWPRTDQQWHRLQVAVDSLEHCLQATLSSVVEVQTMIALVSSARYCTSSSQPSKTTMESPAAPPRS